MNPEYNTENGMIGSLIKNIEKELGHTLHDITVEDARIGLAYTGIKLSNGYGGVAGTPLNELPGCICLHRPIEAIGKPASEVMQMSLSEDLLESVIGMATINTLAQMVCEKYEYTDMNVLEIIKKGDSVSMVGYFSPMIGRILKITQDIHVIEKKEVLDSRVTVVPEDKAHEVIHSSDVVIISGTTLINKTLDGLLELTRNVRDTIILGPSTTLASEPFFEKGVTAVMGVRIYDTDKMMEVVSLAGGTKQIHACCAEKIGFVKKG